MRCEKFNEGSLSIRKQKFDKEKQLFNQMTMVSILEETIVRWKVEVPFMQTLQKKLHILRSTIGRDIMQYLATINRRDTYSRFANQD